MLLDFLKNIGWTELIILALAIAVIFGTNRLIGLSRTLGTASKELKKVKQSLKEVKEGVT